MRIVSVSPTGKTPSCLGPARVGHCARWVWSDAKARAARAGSGSWRRTPGRRLLVTRQGLWVFQRGNYDAGTVTPSSSAALLYPSSAGWCVREANPPAALRLRLLDRVREAIRKDHVTMLPAAIIAY